MSRTCTAAMYLWLVLIIFVQNSKEKAGTGAKEREEAAVEKRVGVIEHCRITDSHLGFPTGAHVLADPSSTYDCNIYTRFIYDQGHCNISCYMIY